MIRYIYTIGFSKKNLRKFIKLLKKSRITHLIDIRLNNTSQLSGFAKRDDLEYIMELVGIKYIHDPSLAPDEKLLADYKKKRINWDYYVKRYNEILLSRKTKERIEEIIGTGIPCFLCSEENPNQCHRKLLVEYMEKNNKTLKSIHLI